VVLPVIMADLSVKGCMMSILYLDADLTFRTHVNAVVKACFAALHQIRSVRRCLRRQISDDVDSFTRHHQGGLLQLAVSRCFQSVTQQVAVRIQRRCTDDLLDQEVGAHHSTVA